MTQTEIADGKLPPVIYTGPDIWRSFPFEGSEMQVEVESARDASIRYSTASKTDPKKEYVQYFRKVPT